MALARIGTGLFGYVDNADGSTDATLFLHLSFLPLVPLGTRRASDGVCTRPQARWSPCAWRWSSLLAAYWKSWGIFLVAAFAVVALDWSVRVRSLSIAVAPAVAASLLLALLIASWLWLGRSRRRTSSLLRKLAAPLVVVAPAALTAALLLAYDDNPSWLARACDHGDLVRCHRLATNYRIGMDVARDPDRAEALDTRACAAGFSAACTQARK